MRRIELPEAWRGRAIVIAGEAPDGWMSESESSIANSFHLPKRRDEWLLSRVAAKQLALDLGLCDAPAECVIDRPEIVIAGRPADVHLSISHSHGFAAAAIDAGPVGVDVERVRDIRGGAAHLFLSEEEAEAASACRMDLALLHFWAAKEAAWKQREGTVETLKKVPLKLEAETATGLRFDIVETVLIGEIVVALTCPTSSAGSWRR